MNTLLSNGVDLNALIEGISKNKDILIDFNLTSIQKQLIKRALHKSMFSVVDYLKKVNLKQKNNTLSPIV